MACCAVDIGLTELLDDIAKAFENGLVDPTVIDFEYVSRKIGTNKAKKIDDLKRSKRHSPIEDTVKEFRRWACFNEKQSAEPDVIEDRYINSSGGTFIRTEKKSAEMNPVHVAAEKNLRNAACKIYRKSRF